jgi:hypothetical protein
MHVIIFSLKTNKNNYHYELITKIKLLKSLLKYKLLKSILKKLKKYPFLYYIAILLKFIQLHPNN